LVRCPQFGQMNGWLMVTQTEYASTAAKAAVRGREPRAAPKRSEQGLTGRHRRVKAEVLEGRGSRRPSSGRALDETLLQQVRLVDVLDGVLLLPHSHRQSGESHRAAAELDAHRAQDLTVQT